jgi:hypothetical protein
VPEICRFHGIVITMYWADHGPPHFHALPGDEALVAIEGLALVSGSLPGPQLRRVRAWADARRDELAADWALAQGLRPLEPIEPLP